MRKSLLLVLTLAAAPAAAEPAVRWDLSAARAVIDLLDQPEFDEWAAQDAARLPGNLALIAKTGANEERFTEALRRAHAGERWRDDPFYFWHVRDKHGEISGYLGRLGDSAADLNAALAERLKVWAGSRNLWLRRSSLVALVPLWWAGRGRRSRSAALLGFAFGVTFLGLTLAWLVPVSILGWSVLVAGQAGFFALLLAYVAAVWREERPFRTALAVAVGWAAVEWLRGTLPFGGFTWGGLGTTQHDNPFLLPLASVLGVWGISAVVAAINVLAFEAGRLGYSVAMGAFLAGTPRNVVN